MSQPYTMPVSFIAALSTLFVLGKVGDAFSPYFLETSPVALLILNSNDLHLTLSASHVGFLPWLLVGTARRLAEDPIFFSVGRRGGDAAVRWLQEYLHASDDAVERCRRIFSRGAIVAVVVEPGAITCVLAGVAGMPIERFLTFNLAGTVARLVLIRFVAQTEYCKALIETLLGFVSRHRHAFLMSTALVALVPMAASCIAAQSWRRRKIR
mmetsp:Transcript_9423/g.31082  ORF Transcript_9423/g.31082 Transcript_9423/m.31082 type:complete len:211 (+) Transcript_9423:36-668(+)